MSLYSFSRGFAVRAATSVIAINWGSILYRTELTTILTPISTGCQRMPSDESGPKKNPFGFIFSNLRTVTDVLEHSNGAEGRNRTGTPRGG